MSRPGFLQHPLQEEKAMYKSLKTRDVYRRALCISLPKDLILDTLDIFFKWDECSGREWAILRFKDIKTDMLQFRAVGLKPQALWVAKTRAGNFSGVFGKLQRLMKTSSWLSVLTLLNLTSSFRSVEITEKQEGKWKASMELGPSSLSAGISPIYRSTHFGRRKRWIPKVSHLLEATVKPSLIPRLLPEVRDMINQRWLHRLKVEHPFLTEKLFEELFQVMRVSSFTVPLEGVHNPLTDFFEVGKVCVTQEPGFKLRVYFDPKVWIQAALEPLKHSLMKLLNTLPWDCTSHQDKATPFIKDRLKKGGMVYSFDLSDATNVFPWGLQHLVLQQFYGDIPLVRFYAAVCSQGCWLDWKNRKWWMRRGQAMGLGPSFPLFAITHGLMVQGLLGKPWDGEFFILGDDIVILNDKLALKYEATLNHLRVPISTSKTLKSNILAEFAGLLVDKRGSYRVPKYQPITRENCLDIVRNFPSWISMLPIRFRDLVRWVLSLPEPHGCGLNPKGLPWELRMTPQLMAVLEREDLPRDREVSLSSKWLKWDKVTRGKTDEYPMTGVNLPEVLRRLDQRRKDLSSFPGWKLPEEVMEQLEGFLDSPLPFKVPETFKHNVFRKLPLTFWKRVARAAGVSSVPN
jgi:hypothetical protein